MKNIKSYYNFINESLRDLMKPKSISDIKRGLENDTIYNLKKQFLDLYYQYNLEDIYNHKLTLYDFNDLIEDITGINLIDTYIDIFREQHDMKVSKYDDFIEYIDEEMLINTNTLNKNDYVKLILYLLNKTTMNENLIDKMKPTPSNKIIKYLDNLEIDELVSVAYNLTIDYFYYDLTYFKNFIVENKILDEKRLDQIIELVSFKLLDGSYNIEIYDILMKFNKKELTHLIKKLYNI